MSEPTFYDYIEKLKQLYVIKDYEAWCPQIRSEKSLRAPKKHMFIDPSIAIAALDLSPSYFYNDLDFVCSSTNFANPKSVITKLLFSSIKIFAGFKSL